MKKFIKKGFIALLVLTVVGCTATKKNEMVEDKKIVVSATLDPHAKILEFAKEILKEKGYDLEIVVLDNYYIFNESLNAKEVDANYFQHVPFFNSEIEKNNYQIANVAQIHIEPFGFYSKKITEISELSDGAQIVISNAIADQGRVLTILANAGVITLKDGVDTLSATVYDIVENPKNITFKEVNPELLTTVFEQGEGDLVAINGNYALQAGLNPAKEAVLLESATTDNPYVNILAVHKDFQNSEKIKVLIEVLTSQEVKDFIRATYPDGSVIPVQ